MLFLLIKKMMLVLGVRTIAVFLSMSMSSSSSLTTTMAFSTAGSGSFAKQSPLFTKSKASAAATATTSRTTTVLAVATVGTENKKKQAAYKPKWVKKQTLAEAAGDSTTLGHAKVGLKGTIPVLFQQGNTTITTKAWAGQPIRDVASQAGQFIQYGCGKGECGTCECKMDGKWIRPCIATVPASFADGGGELVLTLKEGRAKTTSSGTFFSIKSFFMGFWNNVLGMIGFAKFKQKAIDNYTERQEYESLVKQKTLEKRLLKQQQELEQLNSSSSSSSSSSSVSSSSSSSSSSLQYVPSSSSLSLQLFRPDGSLDVHEMEQIWNTWFQDTFYSITINNNNNNNNGQEPKKKAFHSRVRRQEEMEEGVMWYA